MKTEQEQEILKMLQHLCEKVDALEETKKLPPQTEGIEVEEELIEEQEGAVVSVSEEEKEEHIGEIEAEVEDTMLEKPAILVGVTGIKRGIGTTHHCLLFAKALDDIGVSVAIAEFNSNNVLEVLNEEVIIYPSCNLFQLDEIMHNHEVIFLDMGDMEGINQGLFRRCNLHLVIAGCKKWEMQNVSDFFNEFPDQELERYIYLFNHTAVEQEEVIKKGMEPMQVYFTPCCPNPLNAAVGCTLVQNIFPEYFEKLPKVKKTRRRRKTNV